MGRRAQSKTGSMQRADVDKKSTTSIPPAVHDVLRSPGHSLDAHTQAFMESRFGHNFSNVRVHSDEKAAESAQAVNARAYTIGQDIVFGTGEYAPQTWLGKRLIAHELTHVVQQGSITDSTPPLSLAPDQRSEAEARSAAEGIMNGDGTSPISLTHLSGTHIQKDDAEPKPIPVNPEVASLDWAKYVDAFVDVIYDLDYRAEGGRLSEILQVRYADGVTIDIHINEIVDESMSSVEGRNLMAQASIGRGGRIFPKRMNKRTAPNLFAAKEQAIEAMAESNLQFIIAAMPAVIFIITMGVGVGGAPKASRTRVPKSSAPMIRQSSKTPGTPPPTSKAAPAAKTPPKKPWFAKPSVKGDPKMPAGEGATDALGNVTYSTKGTAKQQALAKSHELVHRFLSPKFKLLRELRAYIGMTAYKKSQFLRYLEEALAETYAQMKVNGVNFKSAIEGIKFPIANGYVTIKGVVTEAALGTVIIGGVTYGVYVVATSESKSRSKTQEAPKP